MKILSDANAKKKKKKKKKEEEEEKKTKRLKVSNFALLTVAFKWHHGSEGVNPFTATLSFKKTTHKSDKFQTLTTPFLSFFFRTGMWKDRH